MSLGGIVARGRAAAERLMVDTCTIKRPTGMSGTDPVTETYAAAHYTGACRVVTREVDAITPDAGEREATVLRLRVDLPATTSDVRVGDVVTVTASTYDAQLVGRSFRVVAPFHGSQKTARRVPVEEML
jgi:hypothetical protein